MKGLLFFSAWSRAWQNLVPTQQSIARIAEESSERITGQLADTEYGPYLSLGEESVEKMIEKEREGFAETLRRLGADNEILELLFLRSRMEEVAREIKAGLFDGKEAEGLIDAEVERGMKAKPANSAEVDDWAIRRFEDLSVDKARKLGDERLASRLESLFSTRRAMREEGPEDGVALRELEDAFLREADLANGSLSPLMALMVRKMRSERMIRMAVGARRLGFDLAGVQYDISKIRGIV